MTVEAFLSLVGGDRDRAWDILLSSLVSACVSVGVRPEEAEDVAHEAITRVAEGGFTALRKTRPGVALSAWSRGLVRNLLHERRRDRGLRTLAVEPPEPDPVQANRDGWEGLDLTSLSAPQAQAVRARLDGQSERAAAETLGISRAAFRGRIRAAIVQMKRACGNLPPLPEMSRGWAEDLLDQRPTGLNARDRTLLLYYARGLSRAEIGGKTGLSVNGVRCVLRKLKRGGGSRP